MPFLLRETRNKNIKKILIGLTLFVAGFVLSTSLFFDGYLHDPILEWRWSLKNRQYDCLILWEKIERIETGDRWRQKGTEIFCIKNNAKELLNN